ncbi:DUF2599 domain-containing protein [Virgibacillus indicus]|uniref:DUF2599 domain-containing protein n=1 Tax=Virgibacillus indicus TaxID=2024554 RepID=UPI00197DDB1A
MLSVCFPLFVGRTPYWKNQSGLYDQYSCHYGYAATKNPWNIEPWRPDVSTLATIIAKCNPK